MPRPANPQTEEALRLTVAIAKAGATKAQLADALDVTPGLVSQYASGHRPVPWDRAEAIASALGISPAEISLEYRRIQDHFGPSHLARLTASTISRAAQLMRQSTRQVVGKPIDIEADPELFAELLRLVILEQTEAMDGERGVRAAGRPRGGASGAAREAETGDAAGFATGRQRKRA